MWSQPKNDKYWFDLLDLRRAMIDDRIQLQIKYILSPIHFTQTER